MIDNNKLDVNVRLGTKPLGKLLDAVAEVIGDCFDPTAIEARAVARGNALVTKTKRVFGK